MPFDTTEIVLVFESVFISRQKNVELDLFCVSKLVFANHLSTRTVTDVGDRVEIGSPSLELSLPSGKSRERNDDEERTVLLLFVEKVGEERT